MKSLKYLNHYFLKYKYRLLLGFLFVAISNILMMSQGEVIEKATNRFESFIKGEHQEHDFSWLSLIMLALALGSGIFMFLKRQFIIVLSRFIETDLKNDIYEHYQRMDLAFYKRNNTGDLMNRISEDVSKVRMYIGPAVMYIVDTFFTIATGLAYMINKNALLTLVVFIPLPILSIIIFRVSSKINKRSTKVQENLSELTSNAQESFSDIRVIKAYNKENFFLSLFSKQADKYKESALQLARIESLFHPVITFMIGLSLIALVYYGGKLYISGSIAAGTITASIFIVYKLTWPFASLGWTTSIIQRAAASQERINEFLNAKPAITNTSHELLEKINTVEFKNVSFVYPDTGIEAIKNISFTLSSSETLAIVGPTGSGKSTVATLLTRFYDCTKGEVTVNQRNIKDVNLFELRKRTGYVPQEVFLFSDSINNNIAFGLPENTSSLQKIKQAAKDADVHENIMGFEKNYETIVGERGVMLSGGQKQRLSIARAIIKEPDLLIFDDCLSAVDTETEDTIIENLKRIMRNKPSLIISHRISSIKHANKIIYLKNGEIVEQGTHEELLALGKEYAELYKLQQIERTTIS